MSLFEKLNNKRYDLQERTKKFPPKDEGSSNNTSNTTTQNQQKNIDGYMDRKKSSKDKK